MTPPSLFTVQEWAAMAIKDADPRVDIVAAILVRESEGPGGKLHPWQPFDVHRVALRIIAAIDQVQPEARI